MKLQKYVIVILPPGVVTLSGSLEIELGKSGGEEVQEYTFMLYYKQKRSKLQNYSC